MLKDYFSKYFKYSNGDIFTKYLALFGLEILPKKHFFVILYGKTSLIMFLRIEFVTWTSKRLN